MEDLKKAKRNWEEKRSYFELQLSILASPSQKFEIKKGIQECEEKIKQINARLNSFESEVGISQQKTQLEVSPPAQPKKIQILSANPKGTSQLRLDEEMREIKEGLRREEIQQFKDKIKERIANVKLSNDSFDPYSKLDELLKNKRWKDADKETIQIILYLTNRIKYGFLREKDIDNIACISLLKIDLLWLENSNNRFGLSMQRHIWLRKLHFSLEGNQLNNSENLRDFGKFVGWYINDELLKNRDNYKFTSDAPQGHLPSLRFPCSEFAQDNLNWKQSWKRIFKKFLLCTDKCLLDF